MIALSVGDGRRHSPAPAGHPTRDTPTVLEPHERRRDSTLKI